MAIDPKTRGLEDETPTAKTTEPASTGSPATAIVKVLEFGPGKLKVEMNNGDIHRREGGSLAWRNNNPGNVKFGEFAKSRGAVGEGFNDMAVFPTFAMGATAQRELLFKPDGRYFKLTIQKAISIYAPDYDGNDSEAYTAFVCSTAKLSKLKPLNVLTGQERDRLLEAMQKMECSKPGVVYKGSK